MQGEQLMSFAGKHELAQKGSHLSFDVLCSVDIGRALPSTDSVMR